MLPIFFVHSEQVAQFRSSEHAWTMEIAVLSLDLGKHSIFYSAFTIRELFNVSEFLCEPSLIPPIHPSITPLVHSRSCIVCF